MVAHSDGVWRGLRARDHARRRAAERNRDDARIPMVGEKYGVGIDGKAEDAETEFQTADDLRRGTTALR